MGLAVRITAVLYRDQSAFGAPEGTAKRQAGDLHGSRQGAGGSGLDALTAACRGGAGRGSGAGPGGIGRGRAGAARAAPASG